jgi:hypothetical protein
MHANEVTLQAITDNNLIFISAQPDEVYFHWQVELYLYQFAKHGIADRCYAVFGYKDSPSNELIELTKKFNNIVLYKDDRVKTHYVPNIVPHLLQKFFRDYPHLGKNVFCHDSDILLIYLPKFELMLNDDIAYLSDTISYIGANYIKDCTKRYREKHPQLPENDLLTKMCECISVPENLVEMNEQNSGGAQYLLKNVDSDYWQEVESKSTELYDILKNYETEYPIEHHIQSWTAGMWAQLWLYWKRNKVTQLHKELDFSWGTWSLKEFETYKIFHLAGVTESNRSDKFFKGAYNCKNVFDEYKRDPHIFDHVSPTNATYGYCSHIKEYIYEHLGGEYIDTPQSVRKFTLIANQHFDGEYIKDVANTYFDKQIWRRYDNTYLMFYNTTGWVLTATAFECEISKECGGYAFNTAEYPFLNNWNVDCEISRF